jgi:DNA-binding CsgD family transcriptional regulator
MTLTEREVHTLGRLIDDSADDEPGLVIPWSTLRALLDIVGCDSLSALVLDLEKGTGLDQAIPEEVLDEAAFWAHFGDLPGRWTNVRPGLGTASVARLSDFLPVRAWRNTGLYSEYFSGTAEHVMKVLIHVDGPTVVEIAFFRDADPDFSERDRTLLGLLGPHLSRAFHASNRRRTGAVDLTARQSQLLQLVASGYTNAQIGRRLGISANTVRKHLENVFERLDVHSRTAAVTRAGLPPAPTR